MAVFPGGLASFTGFTSSHTLAADNHAAQHNLEQGEILAVQTKVGTGSSTPISGTILRGTGVGTSSWSQVVLTTDITGILPTANGGTGQTNLTGLPLVSPTITGTVAGGATYTTPILTIPTIADFSSATHTHANNAGGGQLGNSAIQNDVLTSSKIDWSSFSNNIKSVTNTSSPALTNSSQDLASSGLSLSFTVVGTAYAIVDISLGMTSTADFEMQPEIRLAGAVVKKYSPQAAEGNASSRARVRSFSYLVILVDGVNVISGGVTISGGATVVMQNTGCSISALVLGEVTA